MSRSLFCASTSRIALLRSAVLALPVVFLAGCAVDPKPFVAAELGAQGAADRAVMFGAVEPVGAEVSLAEAIARTLKYNLDARTKDMENAVAYGQMKLDSFEGLPKLVVDSGYVGRSDHATTNSRDSVTLTDSLANPSYSIDRDRKVASAGMSWNILDFGVSWYTAKQNGDRYLIAQERRRKTTFSLIQEVQSAYWRAYASQVMAERISAVIGDARAALENSRKVEGERMRSPLETLRFQKTLLENLRQLGQVEQDLASAKTELAALMNVAPGTEFRLAVSGQEGVRPLPVGMEMDKLEELAFQNNPDIREQVYQTRISVQETRKALLRLLPGISFNVTQQYDSNSFLIDNRWYESGAKLSWNLLTLLSGPAQVEFAEAGVKVADARRLALRMAVLAQTHIGVRQFGAAAQQYENAREIFSVDQKISEAVLSRAANDAQSQAEAVSNRTIAIASEYRSYQAYAQAQAARARIFATVGLSLVEQGVAEKPVAALTETIAAELQRWDQWEFAAASRGAPAAEAAAVPEAPEVTPVALPTPAQTPAVVQADTAGSAGSSSIGRWFRALFAPQDARVAVAPQTLPSVEGPSGEEIGALWIEHGRRRAAGAPASAL